MIKVTFPRRTRGLHSTRVDGVLNREDSRYFSPYVIFVQMGFDAARFLVFADNAQDAIDILTDSSYGHLIKVDDSDACDACLAGDYDHCECDYAGNHGDRVDLDNVYIAPVASINWFAKGES